MNESGEFNLICAELKKRGVEIIEETPLDAPLGMYLKEIERVPLLTAEQEKALANVWKGATFPRKMNWWKRICALL